MHNLCKSCVATLTDNNECSACVAGQGACVETDEPDVYECECFDGYGGDDCSKSKFMCVS